jgi:hypothetical protein
MQAQDWAYVGSSSSPAALASGARRHCGYDAAGGRYKLQVADWRDVGPGVFELVRLSDRANFKFDSDLKVAAHSTL